MNTNNNENRSHVVPKWLEYSKALGGSELNFSGRHRFKINEKTIKDIEKDFKEFHQNPEPILASNLLGSAIIVGDESLSRDMAKFILGKGGVNSVTLELAEKVLNPEKENPIDGENARIHRLKQNLIIYPRNAISWVQLSRLYTIKGQNDKAKEAARTAVNLAPHDRYVVRCAVRFFIHIGDLDSALYYIKKATSYSFDPWLKATEINVSLIANKKVSSINKYLPRDPSLSEIFQYSELFESSGILDLEAGNKNRAKKQFRMAWRNPSDNVITHAEWIIRNKLPGLSEATSLNFDKSLEAKTWRHYTELELDNALEAVREWILEEPYSKFPFILGSCIASNSGKPREGAKIAQQGLRSNPDNIGLINNYCYSLIKANELELAEELIGKIKSNMNKKGGVFCRATYGLYEIKKNNLEKGRRAYLDVFDRCKKDGAFDLVALASLNLAIAEIEAGTPEAHQIASQALDNSRRFDDPDILLLRKALEEKLEAVTGM